MKLLRRFRNLLVPHRTKSRRPTNRDELFSSLRITRLERRIVLNGDAAGLELVALDAPNDGQADTFPVSHDGSNVAISVHEQDVATAPAGAGSAVQIQGSSDDDTNIIGFSADDPLQGVEMVVDGGEGMNTLALVGQGEVEVVDHQFVNESLSRVEFESATGVDSMTDANMESVNNPFVAQERQFQTGADPDEINLGVGVDPNDGVSQFDQGSGQNTDLFVNPIDNSVIDAVTGVEPDGDVVNDVVNILGADSRFRGDLLVHANASNSMVATPELDLGSGQLLTSVDNWSVETGTTKDTLVHFDTLDGEFEDPAISELQTSGTPGYDVFDSVDGESQVARWATHDATIDFSSPVFENLGSENLGSKNLGGQDGVPNEGILPSDVTTTGTSLDPSFSGDLVSKQSGPSVATLPMAQLDSLTILSAADDDRLTIDSTTHAIDLSVSFDHDRAEVAGGVTLGTVLAGALTTEDQGGTPAASAFRGATKGGPSVTVSGVGNDDEVFEVRNVDGSFQVLRDGVVVSDLSTTDTEIVIYGGGGDDVLEIADTSAIPAAGITFHGGAGEDDLNVSGTDVFLAPDATLGAGTVFADGGVIEFTGIEPNTITISEAAVVTLDLAGGDTLTFTEENATQTRVTGTSNSFVFTNPTDQLVINMTDGSDYTLIFEDLASDFNPGNGIQINGNAGTDIVTITDLGDSLTSAINIDLNALGVGGDDSVVFETNAQTPSTLNISAGTITTTTADLMVTDASFSSIGGGTITLGALSTVNDLMIDGGGPVVFSGEVMVGGDLMASADGDVAINADVSATDSIAISSGGAINGAGLMTAPNAVLRAATGIGSVAPIKTAVTNLAFSNTTSGNVEIDNTGSLTIGSVGGQTTSSNTGGDVVLSASSPITFAVNTSSAGTLTAMALESATVNFDNITVNAGVTVESTGADVVFEAGDRIIVNATATLSAGGDVTLDSGFGDTDGDGSMTLDGTVSANATNGVVTLDLNAQQGATQAVGGTLSGNGLRLLSTGASGSFGLGASTTNDVATIAAATGGTVAYRDANALNVGTVTTVGITTSNDDVRLQTGTTLAIGAAVALGSGDLTLDAGGAVTQTAAASGGGLELLGSGPFTLTNAGNDFVTLAANTSEAISYRDANALSVGTVTGDGTVGITTSDDDVRLHTGTTLAIGAAVALGSGDLTLDAGGAVTQTAAASGGGLELLGSGPFTLTSAGNDFATLAANTSEAISYRDANALSVGTVTGDGTVGITTSDDDVRLQTGTTLAIGAAVALGSGDLTLDAGGAVTQTAAASGGGLELLGSGPFTLTNAGNDFATLAANTSEAISYRDANALSVGTVTGDGTVGITTSDDDVRLQIGTTLAIGAAVALGSGGLTLDAGGAVTQTAAASGGGLELLGSGPFTLTSAGNDFATLAANTSGAISYRDANALSVGTVTGDGTVGITTSNDDVRLQTGTTLAIGAAVALGSGDLTLDAGGAVTQTAAASGGGLELLGSGPFTLTNAGNDFVTLAANTSEAISYRDANALSVGTVTGDGTVGITTSDDDVRLQTGTTLAIGAAVALGSGDLTLDAGGAVTQTAAASGGGLELLGSGPFALTNAGNDFATLAANTSEAISYRDANALSVGTVTGDGTVGITTSDDDVRLQTGTTLAIGAAVALGSGDLTLDVGGAVTQTAAASGGGLELLGSGPFTLTNAGNDFVTLAANTSAAISYRDANALSVGTVTGDGTVGITTSNDDVRLQTGTTLAIGAAVALGSGDLTLDAGGAVTQTAAASGGGLELLGSGPFTLTNAGNDFVTLAANTSEAISYRDANALSVGTVTGDGTVGITTSNDDVRLQTGTTLAIGAAVALGSGDLTLDAGGAVTQTAAASGGGLELLGSGPFTLTNAGNDFATLAANTSEAISYQDANALSVGTVTGDGTVGITTSNDDVRLQTGTTLAIGAAVALGSGDLTLDAGGAVTQTAAASGGGLELLGSGPFTLTNAGNDFATLAANTSAAISYRDANALSVGTVTGDGTVGITTSNDDVRLQTGTTLAIGAAVALGSGDLTLDAGGAVTQTAAASGGGLELLGSGPFTLTNAGNDFATLAANTSEAISYQDANALSVGTVTGDGTVGITTSNDDVRLQTGTTLAIGAAVALGSGDLTLDAGGAVTQTAAASGGGLELLGSGPFTLTNAGNDFVTLAANTSEAISYRDANALSVGTVTGDGTVGITTSNDDVRLQTGTTLAIGAAVALGSGDLTLDAGGAVTQTAAASGGGLELLGSGPFTLTNAGNDFATLAANTSEAISYQDANALSVGTVTGDGTVGITTSNDDVRLQTGTTLAIGAAVALGSGDLTLDAGGAVTQTAAASGGGLELLGSGPFTLTNAGNDFATLAANTSAAISYRDANALSVGTVTGDGTVGITTSDDDVRLQTGTTLAIGAAVALGSGDLTLDAGGAVTQTAAASGGGLELLGSGPFTLTNAGNDFVTLAANTSEAISYRDANALSVGTVTGDGTVGITTSNDDVRLQTGTTLAIGAAVALGSGDLTLDAGGAVTQTAAASGGGLELLGSGPFTLTNAGNDFATLAANTSEAISYQDANALSVGTVTGDGTVGITTSNDDVRLQTGTTLAIGAAVALGSGDLTLDAGGAVTQTAAASGGGLELLGSGPFTLTNAGNDFVTLAANTSEAISYRDANALSVGTVTGDGTVGITTSNDDVRLQTGTTLAIGAAVALGSGDLTLDAGGAVTQTAAASGGGLELLGSGPFTLTNAGNDFVTLAANTSEAISYRDANALSVGTVTGDGTVGITTSNDDVRLQTGTTLAIGAAVALGSGDLTLDAGGAVTQTAAASGGGLELLGSGPFTLTNAGNDFATLAANTSEAISYQDANALSVGTVTGDGTVGITTSNDDVTLEAGSILVMQEIAAGDGTVRLTATTGSILDGNGAANNITANDLILRADSNNQSIGTSGGTGALDLTLSGTLTASTAMGSGGIFLGQTGHLRIDSVNADTGEIQLTASQSINESVDNTTAKIITTGKVTLIGPEGIGNTSTLELGLVSDLVLDTDMSLDVTSSGTLTDLAVTLNPAGGMHTYQLTDNSTFMFDVVDVVDDLMVEKVSVPAAANLDFSLTSDTGDIKLKEVAVGTGVVEIIATTGSLLDENGSAGNIVAGDLILRADSLNQSIGTSGGTGALDLTLSGTLTASTSMGSGGIFLRQTGHLSIISVNADTGEIQLTASQSINESVADATDKIITTGKVTLIGPEGIGNMSTLELDLVSDLVLDTDMSLDVTSSGTLTVLAVTVNPDGGPHTYQLVDNDGGTMNLTFTVSDGGADLMVDDVSAAAGNLDFALVSDTGHIQLGAMGLGAGTGSITATEGSIVDSNAGTNNIVAGDVTLIADGLNQAIGASGGTGALDLAITGTLAASTATGSGGIFLVQTGDLVLDVVDASTGDVGLTALGGSMTGVGGTAVVGDFLDLRVTGTGNDIGVSDTVRLAIDATMLHAESGGAIFIRDVTGSIILSDVAMPVAIDAAGAVWISAAEDVFVNGDVTTVDVTAITGAPTIKLEAIGGMVIVDTGVTIETKDSFGNTTARFSDEVFEPDALSGFKTILGTSDITVDGSAEINVTVEDVQGVDFALSIDWGDGSVEAVSSAVDPFMQIDGAISYALTHEYDPLTVNPSDPSVTAIVNIRGFGPESANPADDTIQLFANGSQMLPQATLAITLTLPSGFAIIAPLPQPEPLPQPVAVLGPLDVGFEFLTREPQPVVASTDTVTAGTAVETESRYYELRLVVFDENGELKEIEIRKLDEFIDEDGTKTRFELNLLSKLFKRLPNDRYRLYLHEEGTDRLVIEFVIDQGRPIRTPQTIETDSGTPDPTPQNADEAIGPGNQDNGQTEPAGDGRETPLSQPEDTPPESNQSRLLDPNGAANPRSRRDIALSETIGRTPFVAHGGLVITSRSFAPALKRT